MPLAKRFSGPIGLGNDLSEEVDKVCGLCYDLCMENLIDVLIREVELIRENYWIRSGWKYEPYPGWMWNQFRKRGLNYWLREFYEVQCLIK